MDRSDVVFRRRVDADWLTLRGACERGIEQFRAVFGEAAPVTRANLMRGAEAGLDVEWLGTQLIPAWSPLRGTYQGATAGAWDAFKRAIATDHRAYAEAVCAMGVDGDGGKARRAYDEAITPARLAYQKHVAAVLADLLGLA